MRILNRTNARAGFTIVEIMIVVLLIALLIALAIPAFMRAQAQATRVRCKSNLRQVFIALQNWSNTANGTLPTNIPGGEAYIPWPVGVDAPVTTFADGTTNWIGWSGRTGVAGRVPWGLGKLHAQLNDDLRVFFCPGDYTRDPAATRQAFINDQLYGPTDTPQCSYVYRGRFAPDPLDTGAIRRFQEKDSVKALVMDYYYTGMTRQNHDGYVVILFEDGSQNEFRTGTTAAPTRFIDPLAGIAPLVTMWRAADRAPETD